MIDPARAMSIGDTIAVVVIVVVVLIWIWRTA
jgi:hypothetical protein